MGKRKVNKKKGKKRGKQNSLGRERSRGLGSEVVEMESVGAQEQRVRDTTQIIEEILEKPQVSITQLRKIAAVNGLVNNRLRAKVWPLLLGIDLETFDWGRYDDLAQMDHKDTPVVRADIPRSMNQFTIGLSSEAKEEKRSALRRLLNAVVNVHEGDVHYYQGLHDIGAALILTVGERLAFPLLCKIATCQLRDCTRPTLDAVTELLRLINPIVEMADREIARLLEVLVGYTPCLESNFNRLSVLAKNVARLFDLFLSSHPMMPLYVGAAGIAASRDELIQLTEMCELHSALVNLRVGNYISTDDLILQALSLYSMASPKRLIRRARLKLEFATSPYALLRGNYWVVPNKPDRNNFLLLGDPVWWSLRTLASGIVESGQKNPPITALSMVGMGVLAALVAFKVMDNQMLGLQDQAWESIFASGL